MSILRFDPFRDMERLTSQMASGVRTPALMPMDAWKEGDSYQVALDLPGVDPSSIELTVERNTLTVQAQRQPLFGSGDEVLVAERPQGGFTRQLVLGEGVDADAVQADYTNGVLHLTIPTKPSSQPRRIEVGQGGQQSRVVDVSGGQQQGTGGPAGGGAGDADAGTSPS